MYPSHVLFASNTATEARDNEFCKFTSGRKLAHESVLETACPSTDLYAPTPNSSRGEVREEIEFPLQFERGRVTHLQLSASSRHRQDTSFFTQLLRSIRAIFIFLNCIFVFQSMKYSTSRQSIHAFSPKHVKMLIFGRCIIIHNVNIV